MRSRCCSGPGRPSGDAEAFGRGVTCKARLAHLVGGSGQAEASPTAILQDTHSLVVGFYEVGGLSLLSDYGDRAMGVADNSIRDTAHQSPP
jgi:hypothetical protein